MGVLAIGEQLYIIIATNMKANRAIKVISSTTKIVVSTNQITNRHMSDPDSGVSGQA